MNYIRMGAASALLALAALPTAQAGQIAGIQLDSQTFITDTGTDPGVSHVDAIREGSAEVSSATGTLRAEAKSIDIFGSAAQTGIRAYTEVFADFLYTGPNAVLKFLGGLNGTLRDTLGNLATVEANLTTINLPGGDVADNYTARTPPGGGTIIVAETLEIDVPVQTGFTFRVFADLNARTDSACSSPTVCAIATSEFGSSMTLSVGPLPLGGVLTRTDTDSFVFQSASTGGGGTSVPEPAMGALFALGLMGIALGRGTGRRRTN